MIRWKIKLIFFRCDTWKTAFFCIVTFWGMSTVLNIIIILLIRKLRLQNGGKKFLSWLSNTHAPSILHFAGCRLVPPSCAGIEVSHVATFISNLSNKTKYLYKKVLFIYFYYFLLFNGPFFTSICDFQTKSIATWTRPPPSSRLAGRVEGIDGYLLHRA